jgi:NAD(P)-dependent dehydrogenase (short-subunit alcohol dehydrogenase family)
MMDLQLKDKIAVVTGASKGIGRAVARELASHGCDVVLVARTQSMLDEAVSQIKQESGRNAIAVAVDLREPLAVTKVADTIKGRYDKLDILVNNAGATKRGDFFELTEADWTDGFGTDGFALKFFGYVRMSRAMWPMLKAQKGCVVNVVGAAAKTPAALFTIGGSVNAAATNFTKALAEIGIKDGVRVNAVHPGPVVTDRLNALLDAEAKAKGISRAEVEAQARAAANSTGYSTVEDCARVVAFLASPMARQIVGDNITVDGGVTKSL